MSNISSVSVVKNLLLSVAAVVSFSLCLLVLAPGSAQAGVDGGASSNIQLLDTDANGKLDRITFDIDNSSGDTWSLDGTSPHGLQATDGLGGDITIDTVTMTSASNATTISIQVDLDEDDFELFPGTDANPVELVYSNAGCPTDCIQDTDEGLNTINEGDTDATDTEADAAPPAVIGFDYYDVDADGKIDRLDIAFSETVIAASSDMAPNNILITNDGDFDGIAYGSSDTDFTSADSITFEVTLATESTVADTAEDSGTLALSTTGTFTISDGTNTYSTAEALDHLGAIDFLDFAPPVIASFTYQDADDNGEVDQFLVSFSETLDAGSVLAADDLIIDDDGDFDGAAIGADATDLVTGAVSSVTLVLGTESTVVDTSEDSGTIAISSQGDFALQDPAFQTNSTLGSQTQATFLDGAEPIITSATFNDLDIDGDVDTIRTTWSENITMTGATTDDFTITGGDLNSTFSSAANDAGGDAILDITVTSDTGETSASTAPTILYVAGVNDPVADESSNTNSAVANGGGATTTTDAAAPAVESIRYKDQDDDGFIDTITLQFSETVDNSESDMATNNLTLDDAGDFTGIVIGSNDTDFLTGGDSTSVDITLDTESTACDTQDSGSFSISLTGTFDVDDASGNSNTTQSTVPDFIDLAAPHICTVTTGDSNSDGTVDELTVGYSESVDVTDTNAAADGFPGFFGLTDSCVIDNQDLGASGVTSSTLTVSSCTADDTAITVELTYDDDDADTAIFTNGGGFNMNDDATVSSGTDGAAPVVLSSTPADEADDVDRTAALTLTWSEDLTDEGTVTLVRGSTPVTTADVIAPATLLTITPSSDLRAGSAHTLTISGADSTASGDPNGSVTINFTTDGTFSSGSSTPSGGGATTVTVNPTVCTLSTPATGSTLTGGSVQSVAWSSSGTNVGQIANVRLFYSLDNGVTWVQFSENGEANDGSLDWTVVNAASSQAFIKLDCRDNGGSVVATDQTGPFSIATSTELPVIETPDPVAGKDLMTRDEANKKLPVDFPVDALVKLADDGDPATTVDSAVYYIGLDAKRHPFPTPAAYFSWYEGFDDVQVIPGDVLASIPLGDPVLVRPGTHWVKIQSDPKTYYVEPGYVLRWIKDEATALALGGENWNQNIIDVEPTHFNKFAVGADIDEEALAVSWPAGSLMQAPGNDQINYITSTGRRAFASVDALKANKFQTRFVQERSGSWESRLIENTISGLEDVLFSRLVP